MADLGRRSIGYLPINLAQAVFAFGGVAILTRLLDPAEYGLYAIAIAGLQMGQGVLFAWLHAGTLRFYEPAATAGRLDRHLSTAYAAFAVILVAMAAIMAGAVAGIEALARSADIAWVALAALLARSLLLISLETHRARHRPLRYSALDGAQMALALGLGVGFIHFLGLDGLGVLLGLALANLLCALADLPAMARLAGAFRPSTRELKRFAAFGLPLSLSILLGTVIASSDRLLIGWLLGAEAAGTYAVAYAVADRPMGILAAWLGMSFLPAAIAAMERQGRDAAGSVVGGSVEIYSFVALPAGVGLMLVAEPLCAVLAGAEFREDATRIVPWIAAAGILHGLMMHSASHPFLLAGRTRGLVSTMVVAAAINVGLNLLLLPSLGVIAAAYSTVAAYALGLAVRTVLARRFFTVPLPWAGLTRIAAATAAMAAIIGAVPDSGEPLARLTALVGVGMASYASLALAFDLCGSRAFLRRWLASRAAPKMGG